MKKFKLLLLLLCSTLFICSCNRETRYTFTDGCGASFTLVLNSKTGHAGLYGKGYSFNGGYLNYGNYISIKFDFIQAPWGTTSHTFPRVNEKNCISDDKGERWTSPIISNGYLYKNSYAAENKNSGFKLQKK